MAKAIIDIEKTFPSPKNHASIAYWVPVKYFDLVSKAYKDAGIPVRYKYRGPRAQSIGRVMKGAHGTTYRRTRAHASQDCVREDATHFSVYKRSKV